ncbi:NAD(P)H-quinone oxidoreductase [Aestuariibacter halophilus]|uniref:NAD(P)H-quinone oxidoreductase n=1 Tax=Fluctibacter halophilus TaxID=226011 RepID=A0ABS8G4T5_9ALTE|nr:NAD(P)H-quinone oxidoreductase [Aestuariibacter halophilus]MCC2615529.1 NAD(P)H-quinone oxidoreductase [Aestuariibacter halophilus]
MMQYIAIAPDSRALNIEHCPIPEIAADDVLIKVSAFGVNRADTLQRAGKYPPPPGESDILGLEVAGQIAACGAQVSDWQTGQRVMALVPGGGYAQYCRVKACHVLPIPDGLTDDAAAGLMEVFLTAWQSLMWLGELRQGQQVLIHAGASGVGLAAIQLAKRAGARVAVTASSDAKLAVCRDAGADLLINYNTDDFVEILQADDWQGVNCIVDVVGGDYLTRNMRCLRQDGCIVQLAMLGGRFAQSFDMGLLLQRRIRIQGSTLRSRDDDYKARLIADFGQCLDDFRDGRLTVSLEGVVAPACVDNVHQRMLNNQTQGKWVASWEA